MSYVTEMTTEELLKGDFDTDGHSWTHAVIDFVSEVFEVARDRIVAAIRTSYEHFESISILVLASFGANMLMGELPFLYSLPMWVEAPMVIPVAAVAAIMLLVKNAERRAHKRAAKAGQ